MNTKHTSGEWYAKDGQIYPLQTGKTLCIIPYFDKENEQQKADQTLIAAAPDLLELLQWAVNEIESTPDELSDALLGLIKLKAQKAIEKATQI